MWKTFALWWLAALAANAGQLSEIPHPRLWMPVSAEAAVREKIARDPLAAKLHAAVMEEADRVLQNRTCRYEIPDGKRLLAESRLAQHNIMHSAWAWRFTGEEKYRLRTIAELDAACALKDWNTSHFLDTAEMAAAVATGYDWLYHTLTPSQRENCERAIVEKALKPARHVYDSGGWWSKPRNNWSQVCGSGIALAAAGVAGRDEGLAEQLFTGGLKLIENCEKFYQPDGMYPEGPGYWHYGTDYHTMLLAACGPLERSFTISPVMKKGADAIMHLTGPTRLPFNFADCHAKPESISFAQCWLASHFKDPGQSGYVRDLFQRVTKGKSRSSGGRCFPLCILWLPAEAKTGQAPPDSAFFHGEQSVALFRNGWHPLAAWFAIKGGTPEASHGHMDVGSFCFDARGTRWIHDLGSDNYNMPAYFGNKRFSYFRLQNRSHNTLEINGMNQNDESAPCPLVSSETTGSQGRATFDLSEAYQGSAAKVLRTARFNKADGTARIEDEITAPAGDVVWRAYTDADAKVNGEVVTLRKGGETITLRRISAAGTWSIASAAPPTEIEDANEGFRAVVLTVPRQERMSVVVEIRP